MTCRLAPIGLWVLASMLVGCSEAESDPEERDAPDVTQSHVIPLEYRGRWAETPAACLAENTRRYEIAATRIDRPDFAGKVEQVVLSPNEADVRLGAQGARVNFRMALEGENAMRASYGTRGEFTLRRCR